MPAKPQIDLGLLRGVPVEIEAEVARLSLQLSDLLKLQKGSVIPLSPHGAGPLEIYVKGTRLGRAKFASEGKKRVIQITEVGHVE